MDGTLWVKFRPGSGLSWHLVANGRTRCGRVYVIPSPTVDDLPLGAKSCETCLRLHEHDEDKA